MIIEIKDLIKGEIYKATNGYSIFRYEGKEYVKCLVVHNWSFKKLSFSLDPQLETTQDEKDWYTYCEQNTCIPFNRFLQTKTSLSIQLYPFT